MLRLFWSDSHTADFDHLNTAVVYNIEQLSIITVPMLSPDCPLEIEVHKPLNKYLLFNDYVEKHPKEAI